MTLSSSPGESKVQKEAGPELDAEIAERIMGYIWHPWREDWHRVDGHMDGEAWCGPVRRGGLVLTSGVFGPDGAPGPYRGPVPEFSTSIHDAWRVVEKMRTHPDARFTNLRLVALCYNRTYATFDAHNEDEWTEANGEYATPLAICLAALENAPSSSVPSTGGEL